LTIYIKHRMIKIRKDLPLLDGGQSE